MAWVVQLAAGIPWGRVWDAGVGAYSLASSAASHSYAAAAAMPTECKQATAHAGMVCAGYIPEYHLTPGFGPWPFGWGWLLVGIFLGILIASVVFLS